MTRVATLVLVAGALLTLRAQSPASALGDGGPAIAAQLAYPKGIAVDNVGNIYIADSANHRVRKVTRDGVIRTVAGNGTSGLGVESGSAVQARLSYPGGIAADARGNLYIADGSNRVYKVTPDGALRFFAGNGRRGFSGDGGPATAASLDVVQGLAADADGNVFIVDVYNHRIRKVDTAGVISTVAGSGPDGGVSRESSGDGGAALAAKFANPAHVAIDSAGNLFFSDYSPGRIRAVRRGTITTIGGDGSSGTSGRNGDAAKSTPIISPLGVAVDSLGNVYFASMNRIRKITPDGILGTVAGTGRGLSGDGAAATSAQLDGPDGIALDAEGNLYIADTENCRVRKVSPSGIISTVAGSTRAPRPAGVPGGVVPQ